MDLMTFQILSMLIIYGYISIDTIKIDKSEKFIEEMTNQDYQDIIEYYDICNEILLEILNDFNKDNYPNFNPFEIELTEDDYIEAKNGLNAYPEIKLLVSKLINYIEPKYLKNLILNLQTLKINYYKDLSFRPSYNPAGEYNIEKNIIKIYKNNPYTLSHEFLHAASTAITQNFSYIGFSVDNGAEYFFNGFNEGYTELLNERIFGANKIGYFQNYTICRFIEIMFNNKKDLEIAYFNNQTDVLIKKFLEYGTKEELIYIMKEMDYKTRIIDTYTEFNELIDMVCEIIYRKEEPDKIFKCEQLKNSLKNYYKNEEPDTFIKKLVKKFN